MYVLLLNNTMMKEPLRGVINLKEGNTCRVHQEKMDLLMEYGSAYFCLMRFVFSPRKEVKILNMDHS